MTQSQSGIRFFSIYPISISFILLFIFLIQFGQGLESNLTTTTTETQTQTQVSGGFPKEEENNEVESGQVEKVTVVVPDRTPKFGFNIPLVPPSFGLGLGNLIPGLSTTSPYYYDQYQSSSYPLNNNNNHGYVTASGTTINGNGNNYQPNRLAGAAPFGIGIASTVALIKGGVLGGLTAMKAAILPPIFIVVAIAFLIAGAAFFTCNVINCGDLLNKGGEGFGSSFSNIFNRNDRENVPGQDPYGSQVQQVYSALDEGRNKYEGPNAYPGSRVTKELGSVSYLSNSI